VVGRPHLYGCCIPQGHHNMTCLSEPSYCSSLQVSTSHYDWFWGYSSLTGIYCPESYKNGHEFSLLSTEQPHLVHPTHQHPSQIYPLRLICVLPTQCLIEIATSGSVPPPKSCRNDLYKPLNLSRREIRLFHLLPVNLKPKIPKGQHPNTEQSTISTNGDQKPLVTPGYELNNSEGRIWLGWSHRWIAHNGLVGW